MNLYRIQINSGVGPIEVRTFVFHLSQTITRLLKNSGLTVIKTVSSGDESSPQFVVIEAHGDVPKALGGLLGTHVLVARNARRGRRARKRWFAGVSIERVEQTKGYMLDLKDVEIKFCRAGGPGGQHVNKTSSAVRLHHRPSGITVRASGERSQLQNKTHGLRRLQAMLEGRAGQTGDIAQSRGSVAF